MNGTGDFRSEVRTRFAPSPTGFLHVGGVRTNFFAWLLARHCGGRFLLRIEDTDRERLVPDAVKSILEDLSWLGIDIDEGPSKAELDAAGYGWKGGSGIGGDAGPYIQSLKRDRHREVAEKLVATGFAYRCDCTPEMLEAERRHQAAQKLPPGYSGYCRDRNVPADRPHVIRFRVPEATEIRVDDLVKGPVIFQDAALRDTVILKSDGYPTYHLASVVDDHDMRITHVIRGDEWLSTAPIHVLLYDALGWDRPAFAHLPPVLGADGKKLSKRHGATYVSAFRELGYLPEALLNYLLLLGWAPGSGDEQEIFSRDEMIGRFSMEHVSTAGAVFSEQKLRWMNGMYIRAMDDAALEKRLLPFVERAGLQLTPITRERFRRIVPHIKERIERLDGVAPLIEFLFVEDLRPELGSLEKRGIGPGEAAHVAKRAADTLERLEPFDERSIEAALKGLAAELEVKQNVVFMTVRVAVTGREGTPPLAESIVILGRDATLRRLRSIRQPA